MNRVRAFLWLCWAGILGMTAGRAALAFEPPVSAIADPLAFPTDARRTVALTGARIVVAPGKVLENATLVIRDGRIAAVGAGVVPPVDATVRIATGRIIYPGFIDAYSTLAGEPSLTTLATPLETAGPSAAADGAEIADGELASPAHGESESDHGGRRAAVHPLIRPATDARWLATSSPAHHALFRSQGFVARLAVPGAGVVRGTSVLVATDDAERSPNVLAADVALHAHLYVPRSPRRTSYPNSPMGAVALARQTFLDAHWLRQCAAASAERTEQAPQAEPTAPANTATGTRGAEGTNRVGGTNSADAADRSADFPLAWRETHQRLWPFLPTAPNVAPSAGPVPAAGPATAKGQGWVMFDAETEQYLLRAERFAREFGLRAMFRGGGREYRRAAEIAATGRPLILPLAFPAPPRVDSAEAEINAELDDLMHWRFAPENPARMERAGSRIALTTHGLESPGQFLPALRKAVSRGWPAEAALRALTTTPAELLGVARELGTLEPGKRASFVVADDDLFTGGGRVLETWIAGQRWDLVDDLPQRLAGLWRLELEPAWAGKAGLALRFEPPGAARTHFAKNAPGNDAPAKNAPGNDAPAKNAPAQDVSKNDASAVELPANQLSTDEELSRSLTGVVIFSDTERSLEISLERLEAAHGRIAARFDSGALGVVGVATLSLHWAGTASAPRLDGTIVWPNGRQSEVAGRPSRPAGRDPASGLGTGSASRDRSEPAAPAAPPPLAGLDTVAVNYPLGAWGRTTPEPPRQPESIVFRGGTVWTCGPAGVLKDADVWVMRGRIVAVGKRLPVAANTVEIRLAGRHLTPGLIDSHSHIATDGGVNETGQALTCQVRIGDFIDANDVNLYRQLAGGTTAALILHGSANPIGGQGEAIKFRWGLSADGLRFVEAPPTVKFALGENVTTGPDILVPRFPQTRMGVEQFHRHALRVARDDRDRWRLWRERPVGPPPRRDLALECLAETLDGRRWIHCHAYRHDETRTLLELLEDFQIRVGCLHHITDGYLMADAILRHGAMVATFTDWWGFKVEALDAVAHNGAFLHRSGIVTSFHSDDRELGRHLNGEAAKAMRHGQLPPAEALKMVTIAPAKQLRVETHVGSVEAGKHADLVVWSGPPLAPDSRCEETWIDGRKYFDRQDDLRRRVEVERLKALLVQAVLDSGEPMLEAGVDYTTDKEAWERRDWACRNSTERTQRQLRDQRQGNGQRQDHGQGKAKSKSQGKGKGQGGGQGRGSGS